MQIGDLFDGKYRIVDILGQGGMSKVYLGENVKLGTYWAIKELDKDTDIGTDLLAEPNILKKLDHPALPRIFDIVEEENCIYVIVDYIDGISLDKKLAEMGKIPENIIAGWAKELCRALEYLHSFKPNPIIYRDMKPSNVIIAKSGVLKLIDFGIAREYKALSGNDTVFIGTRGYAAPEQYGSGQTDPSSDLYSLGVMLHQLLTGKDPNKPPFEIKPVSYYDGSLSVGIESIICKCTMPSPSDRYQSATEMLDDIGRLEEYYLEASLDINNKDSKIMDSSDLSGWDTLHSRRNRPTLNKKLVLTVWDNPEFGCELAYAAAKLSGLSVALMDLDLLAPKADLFLNIKKCPALNPNSGIFGSSGLNSAIDSIEKNYKSPNILFEAATKRKELKNLFILTGNDRIENYEYYRDDTLLKLIDQASSSFDITLLLVNKSIYDSFTVIALARSDLNLAAVRADVDKLREFNNYIVFLKEKQNIPLEKTKFIAFEYDKAINLVVDEVREATKGNLAGKVSYSRKRAAARNLNKPYAAGMEREIIREYASILAYLGISEAEGFVERAVEWVRSLFRAA